MFDGGAIADLSKIMLELIHMMHRKGIITEEEWKELEPNLKPSSLVSDVVKVLKRLNDEI